MLVHLVHCNQIDLVVAARRGVVASGGFGYLSVGCRCAAGPCVTCAAGHHASHERARQENGYEFLEFHDSFLLMIDFDIV